MLFTIPIERGKFAPWKVQFNRFYPQCPQVFFLTITYVGNVDDTLYVSPRGRMFNSADPVTLSTILSALAALVSALTSVFAIAIAYYTFQRTLRAAARPVLVFTLTPDITWQVQNVGTGPAITVMIG